MHASSVHGMLKVRVVYLLYRLSSYGVCLDTISQPSHLPRVHCHKGMVCQRGGGGEHIYIYAYYVCSYLSAHVWIHITTYSCIHLIIRLCLHSGMSRYRRSYVNACIYLSVFGYIHMHTYLQVYVRMYIYTHTYVCTCVCVCTPTRACFQRCLCV